MIKKLKTRFGKTSIALAMLLLVGGVLAVGAAAGASDVSAGYSENVTATNDTETIRTTITNITGSETADVVIYEISNHSDPTTRSKTQVDSQSADTSAPDTDTVSKTYGVPSIDEGNETIYEVALEGDGAEEIVIERIGVLGGGGGLLGGSSGTALGGLAVVVAVLFLAAREEM